jgi:hypothetical protein
MWVDNDHHIGAAKVNISHDKAWHALMQANHSYFSASIGSRRAALRAG